MEMLLHELDQSGPIDIRAGEELILELSENPTTGYRWNLEVSGNELQAVAGDTYTPSTRAAGAGGRRTFRFIATQPGIASIHATLSRSWEPNQAIKDHRLSVRIGENADANDQ